MSRLDKLQSTPKIQTYPGGPMLVKVQDEEQAKELGHKLDDLLELDAPTKADAKCAKKIAYQLACYKATKGKGKSKRDQPKWFDVKAPIHIPESAKEELAGVKEDLAEAREEMDDMALELAATKEELEASKSKPVTI